MENEVIFHEGKGRKKKKSDKTRDKLKIARHKAKGLPKLPQCEHKKKTLECKLLSMQDIRRFHAAFYKTSNKIDQDTFILKHTGQSTPSRRRPTKSNLNVARNVTVTYYVNTKNRGMVQVCSNAFALILGVSKFRIQNISKTYLNAGTAPVEKRGGDRRSKVYAEKLCQVRNFIKKLKCVESHYTRDKSSRQYLRCDLTIRKLWTAYNNENEHLRVKYQYFRTIFVTDFNLSFRTPATDACSECISLKALLTATTDPNERVGIITKLRVHNLKAKAFYNMLKEEEENTLKLAFDCQKNLVLPKVPDQSAYYSRQLYLYNFTVCVGSSKSNQTKETVFMFTWTENMRLKGSNEVASMIHHQLSNANLEGIKQINLFCDGCPGQNKNTTMIGMLSHWLFSNTAGIKAVQITFPIVGHSFLPPDRVFGRIEKVIKKMDTIIEPDEYKSIFEPYGTVLQLGIDYSVYDWKNSVESVVKPPGMWHFKFSAAKRILIKKSVNGQILVKGEVNYKSDLGQFRSILKRGKNLNDIKLTKLRNKVRVKPEKINDVDKLLKKHFGDDWQALNNLQYYKSVINDDANDIEDIEVNDKEPEYQFDEEEGLRV